MENLYIDYDRINMILTVKCFDDNENIKCRKKFELSEDFITSITYGDDTEDKDVYGFVISEKSNIESDISNIEEITDYDLKAILDHIILVRNEEEREAIKSVVPNYYCLLLDNIDEDMKDAIKIYKNI